MEFPRGRSLPYVTSLRRDDAEFREFLRTTKNHMNEELSGVLGTDAMTTESGWYSPGELSLEL